MKRKEKFFLTILLILLNVCVNISAPLVYAAEQGEEVWEEEITQDSTEEVVETETEIPESFYLPIESNEIEGWPQGPQIEAESAVVMDADTGAFLYSKNMTAKQYPASITKIMTALVAIENGGDLDKKLKCSEYAVYSIESGSSHCGLQPGEKITLRQALYALMLESANDAANSIAEKVGGSIDHFVEMMNEKAKELGCVNTNFTNTHGLHDENHYTCAYDMALITKAAFENKELAEIAGTVYYTIPKTNKVKEERYFINHHKMISEEEYLYDGCLGGKTGFTTDALNTLVTVAKRDKRKLICVVLRVNGLYKSYDETASLLDYGYDNFTRISKNISDFSISRAELLNVNTTGRAALLQSSVMEEELVEVANKVKLDLPNDVTEDKIEISYTTDGVLLFQYNDWEVGSTGISFLTPIAEIPKPQVVGNVVMPDQAASEAEQQTETASVSKTADAIVSTLRHAWTDQRELLIVVCAALLVFIILLLIIIAYFRNRSAAKKRQRRRMQRQERVRQEEDIDHKSIRELEEEIRNELNNTQDSPRIDDEASESKTKDQ